VVLFKGFIKGHIWSNSAVDLEDVVKRCVFILKSEGVEIEENQKIKLIKYIENHYPDMRRIINDLQKFSVSKKLVIKETNDAKNIAQLILNELLQKNDAIKIRKKVIEQEKTFDSDYQTLFKEIFEMVYDLKISEDKKKMLLLDLGEFMYRDNFVLDHEINFFCCLINLQKSFN
jgi:DNA polymerase III delta prime subunit